MKKILIFTIVFIIISLPSYSQKNILIFGDISNCFTMEGVANANVELLDANGNVVVSDSSKLIVRKDVYENSESYSIDKYSGAIFKLSIKEIQDYKLIINALGYLPYVQHIKADELRSIKNFDAGSIFLHPEPKQQILDEVVVTATKVKMVYKGDTIVYNADAFNVSPSESQSESRRITKIDRGKFKRLFPILLEISVIQGISIIYGFFDVKLLSY